MSAHLQLGGGSMVISASSFWIRLADVLRAFDVIFCTAFASFKERQFAYPFQDDSTAFLTFLVSLLGPSLCSPEAPPAEEDDPDAAVAAVAAEPEADITPLA